MLNNKYIVKSLTPWMMDELIAMSENVKYELILLRKPNEFYSRGIKCLHENGIDIYVKPFQYHAVLSKLIFLFKFFLKNIGKFDLGYNSILGLKSFLWFLKLDTKLFSTNSNIHAQFVTQPSLLALLIKNFYNDEPIISFMCSLMEEKVGLIKPNASFVVAVDPIIEPTAPIVAIKAG